jgi:lipid-A-disaccharide synthase
VRKKIFIIAGEKSGDLLGSKIIDRLDKNKFEIGIVGGESMEKQSYRSIFPMEKISVMGAMEILPRLRDILRKIEETAQFIVRTNQDMVLTIDSPDFCFRVMRRVRELDVARRIKGIHLVAPSVWFYREYRAAQVAKLYDMLLCLLPFEPKYFEKYGLKTTFVGHPIFGVESSEYSFNVNGRSVESYRKNSRIIAVTPGSRKFEIKLLMPIITKVIKILNRTYNFDYCILATENTRDFIKEYLVGRAIRNIEVEWEPKKKEKIIENSLLVLAKSGTNVVEIAAYAVPLMVMYKFDFLTNIFGTIFLKLKSGTKSVNLINILGERDVIPEMLLFNCNAIGIAEKVTELIANEELRIEQIRSNLSILKMLGYGCNDSPSLKIVNKIGELLNV